MGYANGFLFKEIKDVDFDYIENTIRTDMLDRLTEKCYHMGAELENDERAIFYGIYASCPHEFKLVRGDRYLVGGIANHLRELFEKYSEVDVLMKWHAIQCDMVGNWNLSNFRRHVISHGIPSSKNQSNVDGLFENTHTPHSPQSTPQITKKPDRAKQMQTKSSPTKLSTFDDIVLDISVLPIIVDDSISQTDSKADTDDSMRRASVFYYQFSEQSLRVIETALTNGETTKFMVSKIDNRFMNVGIVSILGDGNCVFGALVHQIDYVKSGSEEHIRRTADLRKSVVEQIDANFDRYKQVLKTRLNLNTSAADVIGKEFVSNDLSQEGVWAGPETFMAVAEMCQVNILIFNEKGGFYFSTGFNPQHSRTVFLAYRIGAIGKLGQSQFNHYDSVCG